MTLILSLPLRRFSPSRALADGCGGGMWGWWWLH